MITLPVRSVRFAVAAERSLRAVGLGGLVGVNGLGERVARRWLGRHDVLGRRLADVVVNGVPLRVPSALVPPFLAARFDPLTTRAVRRLLRPGMVAVDVGAHVGYYTLLLASCVGAAGRVIAVEPVEANLELLRLNVEQGAAAPVEICACAAGARDGFREFHITDSSDTHGLYGHPLQATLRIERVDERRLDTLVKGRVDLVKVDVEGAELEVLEGMERLLDGPPPPALVLEWNPACLRRAGRDPASLPAFLANRGYAVEVVDEAAGRVRPLRTVAPIVATGKLPDWWYANIVATRRS
jgi:FkbM family methyltransferase